MLIDRPPLNSPLGRCLRGKLSIRELRGADAPECENFFHHLDREDIRMRFASAHFSFRYFLPGPTGTGEGVAFAALDAAATILGVIHLADLDGASAEVALIVRSDCQRRGIASLLLAHAIHWAASKGLAQLIGLVLTENRAMLALAQRMGFHNRRRDGYFVEIARPISPSPVLLLGS